MIKKSPIILAVDTVDLNRVDQLVEQTRDSISVYKFGLEFYLRHGLERLISIKDKWGMDIFLDLKLHDIPNTVRRSVEAISVIEPFFLTVHGAGGAEMVRSASEALPHGNIAAVTVLTSLDQAAIESMGLKADIKGLVLGFADVAVKAGARALVASPHEVAVLREKYPEIILITPGIRTNKDSNGDQRRVMTPSEAVEKGSDYLVIGRPITESESPNQAAKSILNSL